MKSYNYVVGSGTSISVLLAMRKVYRKTKRPVSLYEIAQNSDYSYGTIKVCLCILNNKFWKRTSKGYYIPLEY